MLEYVDIIVGLCWGDEGKGKISSAIAKDYDMVCRWNGGPNAGHTVYLNGEKHKTHIIPSGVFHGKLSVIGPNCVINIEGLNKELDYLAKHGFDTSLVKIHPNAHIIQKRHIDYDVEVLKPMLGTTGQGIAPCYADKAARIGILAKQELPAHFLWDGNLSGRVLCEGAQSIWLDINHGNYPYVTSSETFPHNACSLGFSPKKIRDIIGVAKIYDTKSGVDPLFPESLWSDGILNKIIEVGEEFGSTTGRKRIVNWLNLDLLVDAVNLSGTNKLIINKCDVLETVGTFKVLAGKAEVEFVSMQKMQEFITEFILAGNSNDISKSDIVFSGNHEVI